MKYIIAFALALSLGACSTTQPAATVAATEIALTSAEVLAFHYVTLPPCGGASTVACSNPALVARIKAADTKAYDAVKVARAATGAGSDNGTVAAASAAVAALVAIVPK